MSVVPKCKKMKTRTALNLKGMVIKNSHDNTQNSLATYACRSLFNDTDPTVDFFSGSSTNIIILGEFISCDATKPRQGNSLVSKAATAAKLDHNISPLINICPKGANCCSDGHYCDGDDPICCGSGCMPQGATCCSDGNGYCDKDAPICCGTGCIPNDATCCDNQGDYCDGDTPVCCDDGCIPQDAVCCNDSQGGYCDKGTYCCETGCCSN
ncbi:hypothetical protein RCL_jg4182.t1 [Rhizophagus clarus]|uniref:Uncharacterized protein n=1 Tax=Rhizophagus clarus TaxID=94130 RepID=A0A8H3QC40_9GLOM|nr:hypothetical protein RCL_jg4182.t1 [Rhizophagus clarus]